MCGLAFYLALAVQARAQVEPFPRIEDLEANRALFTARNNSVYVALPEHDALFRWNLDENAWEEGIRVRAFTTALGNHPRNGAVLIGNQDGWIDTVFSAYFRVNGPVTGLLGLASRALIASTAGPLPQLHLIDEIGHLRQSIPETVADGVFLTSRLTSTRFYFRSETSIVVQNIDYATLQFSDRHENTLAPDEIGNPVALDRTGTRLLLKSGVLFDTESLAPTGQRIATAFDDAVWLGSSQLVLVSRTALDHTRVERRTLEGTLLSIVGLPGKPVGIEDSDNSGQVVVTLHNRRTRLFRLISLNRILPPESPPPVPLHPLITLPSASPQSLDLDAAFLRTTEWELLNYRNLEVANRNLVTAATIDLESNVLRIETDPFGFGESEITLLASNGSGEVEGSLRIQIDPPDPPAVEVLEAPRLNPQTGLYEQRIRLTNHAGRGLGACTLQIAGLAAGTEVYNRSSQVPTGDAVVFLTPRLADGESVEVVIEYMSSTRTRPVGMTFVAAVTGLSGLAKKKDDRFAIDRTARLADGSFLLEFPSSPGSDYRIEFSAEGGLGWDFHPTRLHAAGERLQWIDRPPPNGGTSLLYRVRRLDLPGDPPLHP